jgi:hypothetical protein
MTLTEFLLARVAEDEAIARAATPGPWYWEEPSTEKWPMCDESLVSRDRDEKGYERRVLVGWGYDASGIEGSDEDRAHIAHHDPARVLAECTAKRQIIDIHSSPFDDIAEAAEQRGSAWEWFTDDERTLTRPQYLVSRGALRVLALPYAGHPDYRDEWR